MEVNNTRPSQKDLIDVWSRFTNLLNDDIERELILVPLIRRWAGLMGTSYKPTVSVQNISKAITLIREKSDSLPGGSIESYTKVQNGQCDVLFVPSFSRINCLGVSQSVAKSIWDIQPTCKIGIIPPEESGEVHLSVSLDERFFLYYFPESKIPSPLCFSTSWKIYKQIKERIKADSVLNQWFQSTLPIRLLEIARYIENKQRGKTFLQQLNCREIICLNEQVWPASSLIPAARELGIKTCQILHGTPTRLYAPFICDETWVWGKGTYNMFLSYGTPPSKLFMTGNLESSFWLSTYEKPRSEKREKKYHKCLFLSQWAGSKVWGTPGFDEPLVWLSQAMLEQSEQWIVTVRLHPNDGVEAKLAIKQQLSFLEDRLIFSDGTTPLSDDINQADFVCTGSSTAVLMAFSYGIPGLLLWTPIMDYIHGQPFLDNSFVVYSAGELEEKMSVIKQGVVTENVDNISELRPDSILLAAKHVLDNLCMSFI